MCRTGSELNAAQGTITESTVSKDDRMDRHGARLWPKHWRRRTAVGRQAASAATAAIF